MTLLRKLMLNGGYSPDEITNMDQATREELVSLEQQGYIELKHGRFYLTKTGYFKMVQENPDRHRKT